MYLRGAVVLPAILFCALPSGALARRAHNNALQKDAAAILAQVRETYRTLFAYHFARVLVAEEAGADGTSRKVAEVTLDTATDRAKFAPEGAPSPPLNIDRIRLGTKTARRGEMLLVCDGVTCWSYTSQTGEYMTGNRFRDVSTSVGGSALIAVHLFPFFLFQDGAVQDARVAREEEVEVGGDRRMCDVIEGSLITPPIGDPTKPPPPGSLGFGWLLTMLTLQGLADEAGQTMYSPWPSGERVATAGEAARVTLWIDRERSILVRSGLSGQVYKSAMRQGGQTEQVTVAVTDSFTTATVGSPPADVFRFTPPPGATQVPNAATRRDKKP